MQCQDLVTFVHASRNIAEGLRAENDLVRMEENRILSGFTGVETGGKRRSCRRIRRECKRYTCVDIHVLTYVC